MNQKQQDMEDQGYDDYELPEVSQYAYCTPMEIQNKMYYFQMGCADGESQALAVNIYEDNTCTTRSYIDGYDDANIDVSELQVRSVGKAYACFLQALFSLDFANNLSTLSFRKTFLLL